MTLGLMSFTVFCRRALGEQPVKTVLLTTFLGPIVHQVGLIVVPLVHCEDLKSREWLLEFLTVVLDFWFAEMYGFVLFSGTKCLSFPLL